MYVYTIVHVLVCVCVLQVKCQKSVRTRGLLSSDKGSDITGHYNRIYDTLLGISEQIQDPVL